jgi:suppressor for copper-sensitivity B
MKCTDYILVCLSFLLAGAATAGDFASAWKTAGDSNSRIILEADGLAATGTNRAGVQIRLGDGWWTYWRAPGSSGIPPVFDWTGSKNVLGKPELKWPVPRRTIAYGEPLNLYRDEVVFPVEFRAVDPAKPVKLSLRLTYGICRNMCVPASVTHELTVAPSTAGKRSRSASNVRLISTYANQQPSSDPLSTGFEIQEVWETHHQNVARIGVRLQGLPPTRRPFMLIEGPDIFQAAEVVPRKMADPRQVSVNLTLGKSSAIRRLTGKRLRITIVDGSRALEQIWVVGAAGSSAAGTGLTPVATTTDIPQP